MNTQKLTKTFEKLAEWQSFTTSGHTAKRTTNIRETNHHLQRPFDYNYNKFVAGAPQKVLTTDKFKK